MIAAIGRHCLTLALLAAAWACAAAFLGGGFGYRSLYLSSRRALYAVTGLLAGAAALLITANLTDDFRLWVVASYSNRTLSAFYKVSALWGSQAGSLLLWALVLSVFTSVVLVQYRRSGDSQLPFVAAVLAGIQVFFLAALNFASHPFTLLANPPIDGNGLNPQLQTPLMVIHPPCLYLGYVGFSVPYAFAMAALFTGRLGDVWIHRTRRWTIFAWFFLGTGILLGSYWAYIELGWGGYWAWDPVENAALVPWLTGTAFLHSVMIQEKKRMLRVWNMILILLTYCLCILGTFITRSGVISSVHSFTVSSLGPMFVAFLGAVFGGSFLLLAFRLPALRSPRRIESFVSRESSFLFNNLFLLACAFAVLWGTLFPILSEAVRGVKITVGPPFFNQVVAPIALALIALTGICPLIAWRRATLTHLFRAFRFPAGLGIAGAGALLLAGLREPYPVLAFSLCLFVFGTILLEFHRGTRARRGMTGEGAALAFFRLVNRNRRRYGGYLVHLGILLVVFGVAGSWNYRREATAPLRRGEAMRVGPYEITFRDTFSRRIRNADQFGAVVDVRRGERDVGPLYPARNFYPAPQEPSTEVDIRSTLAEDLYLIFLEFDPQTGIALFKAFVNPLVSWIWFGGIVVILGAHFAVLPDRRRERAWRTAESLLPARPGRPGRLPVPATPAVEGEGGG